MKKLKRTNYKKKEVGITLVALVITIIILILLAGIAIASLDKENGIFAKVKQAKGKTTNAQENENIILGEYENNINSIVGSRDTITISKDEYDGLKNSNTYSNDELKIGTWIDGKPLYRKVIREQISGSGSREYYLNTKIPEAESYFIENAIVFNDSSYSGYSQMVDGSNTVTVYDFSITSFNLSTGRLWLINGSSSFSFLQLIVNYTKTTDKVN